MSDFMDFNAYKDLVGKSEQEYLDRDMADVTKKQAAAQTELDALRRRGLEMQAMERGGVGAADAGTAQTMDLSRVAGYSDYLRQKKAADDALTRMRSATGENGALRDVLGREGGAFARGGAGMDRLGANEGRYSDTLRESARTGDAAIGVQRSEAQRVARVAQDRQARDARLRSDYVASVIGASKKEADRYGSKGEGAVFGEGAWSQGAKDQARRYADDVRRAGGSGAQQVAAGNPWVGTDMYGGGYESRDQAVRDQQDPELAAELRRRKGY